MSYMSEQVIWFMRTLGSCFLAPEFALLFAMTNYRYIQLSPELNQVAVVYALHITISHN